MYVYVVMYAITAQAVGRQDWPQVWEIAKTNKGIIFGVVVPLLLVLRFPAAVFAVGRIAVFAAEGVLSVMLMQGKLTMAMNWLWRRIVAHARDKKNRPT